MGVSSCGCGHCLYLRIMVEGCKEYKIVLLGEPGVGKTSFFFRVRDNVFLGHSVSTVSAGIEHLEHEMKIGDTCVKVHLFDTAGGERFRTLTSNYFQNANAIILMFSVEDHYSLERLEDEIDNAKQFIDSDDFVWALVGHKCDLELEIDEDNITTRAKTLNTKVMYASSKTGENVIGCLEEVVRRVHSTCKHDNKGRGDSIQLGDRPTIRASGTRKKSSCC